MSRREGPAPGVFSFLKPRCALPTIAVPFPSITRLLDAGSTTCRGCQNHVATRIRGGGRPLRGGVVHTDPFGAPPSPEGRRFKVGRWTTGPNCPYWSPQTFTEFTLRFLKRLQRQSSTLFEPPPLPCPSAESVALGICRSSACGQSPGIEESSHSNRELVRGSPRY